MTDLSRKLSHAFNARYVAGLVLLGLLVTLTFSLTFRLTAMETSRAEIVSLAANQRALSQRIAFLANAVHDAGSRQERQLLQGELMKNVREMETAHAILTGAAGTGRLRHFTGPLHDIYFTGTRQFDSQVREFLKDARALASAGEDEALLPELGRVNAAGTNYMLQTHGLITRVLQHEAARQISVMERAETFLWVVTLAFLVFEGMFIFRPMSRRIADAVDDVEQAEARSTRLAREMGQANSARTRFFRSASHELRTPLNAILGITAMLRERGGGSPGGTEIEQLERAGEHLLHLVNNLLEMNRLGRDGLELKNAPSCLARDFRAVSAFYCDQPGSNGHACLCSVTPMAEGNFLYDTARLRQVIGNILSVLVNRPEEGKISCSIELAAGGEAGAFCFRFRHSGLSHEAPELALPADGAEPSAASEVDARFVLAIAANIVRRIGGALAVRPDGDHGTCLEFTLVLQPAAEPDGEASLDGKKVLVVDDNIPNQMVACALLQAEGLVTETAGNGEEAVRKAGDTAYDLILMDISMPVMDGVEATRQIRGDAGLNRQAPILALTAHVQQEEIAGILRAGMQEVLHKPVNKDLLLSRVGHWTREMVNMQMDEELAE